MKKFLLGFLVVLSLGVVVQGGTEIYSGKDKEMKQVVPLPCPEWYRDTEWNVSLWGTYVFTGNDEWLADEYIQSDHAWGGGIDAKYFFHRYFGIGVEGWAVDSTRQRLDVTGIGPTVTITDDSRFVGAVKGTLTLRFPTCSRVAPYLWTGFGVIFGGGERDDVFFTPIVGARGTFSTVHHDGDAELIGQGGFGFEVRVTPHVGLINDFSWNWIDGKDNNFGMVRSGVNFAF